MGDTSHPVKRRISPKAPGPASRTSNRNVPSPATTRLRVAAISFLNPAPLLYDFEHEPAATGLRDRYDVRYTSPAQCAEQLRNGEADLGLIPIAALPFAPELAIVPGCTIASLQLVRSIQFVVKPGLALQDVRIVATDSASRSSAAYVELLLRVFHGTNPTFTRAAAALPTMLQQADAALLIGDPALLAMETRDRDPALRTHTWIDVAAWWRRCTGLPWVAAVWAVDPQSLARTSISPTQLIENLTGSRDAGLTHIDTLVQEWSPRIAVPPETIRAYLTENIHYDLDLDCLRAIDRFYALAAETGVLPVYQPRMLAT